LIESAIAGVIGSAAGIVVGSFVARAMAGFIGDIMQAHYGIAERAHEIRFERGLIVSAVAMGVVTSMVAALFPARDAARVDPVRALQKGHTEATTTRESSVRIVCAGVFVLLALVCVASNRSRLV